LARRRKKGNPSNWTKLGSGRTPINGLAARVSGEGKRKPKYEELLDLARKTRDEDKRREILAEAKVARKEYEARLIDKAAERKAKRALERARWLRQEKKW
jgi:hypothetical protein